MKNINVNFENFSNKHKLNLMRVLVSGTLVVNSLALSSCGSINNNEEVISQEEENFEIAKTNNDEIWEYFDRVVEPDMFGTMYINCDNFPLEIKNKGVIPSTFYEELNSYLEKGEYRRVTFYHNDEGLVDVDKIDLSKVQVINYIYMDETWEYFDQVVDSDKFGNVIIDCDNFPEKIKNKEDEISSTFYDKINFSLDNGKYKALTFRNDFTMLDYSKIYLANAESVEFENCFIYDSKGELIFKDPTSEYIDLVLDTDGMHGIIYINCDEFPEEIKNREEVIPPSFYNILNNYLKTGDYKLMIFYNDTGIINHSVISSDYVEEIRFEPSLGIPPKYLLK